MEPTVHDRVTDARLQLRAAGIPPEEADLDARLLAQHVLGWGTERYLTDSREALPDGFDARYANLIARRRSREPLAYITGRQEFWGLTFDVTPAVLIPRPESELIVELALECLPATAPVSIVDVCTGSGCIAIALAKALPRARVVATDLSSDALAVARRNAVEHAVHARLTFSRGDLLLPVEGPFDLITCNPPYVPAGDQATLQPEVVGFEPHVALFGGPDGLDAIRRLLPLAAARLLPGGWLIAEFGFGQAEAVRQLISDTRRLKMVSIRHDLQGIPRTVVARRSE